jgi:hypothetical protein
MEPMDLISKLFVLGPSGLIGGAVVLCYALYKSEQRESKKDIRIQLLENQLRESYDERINAAETLSNALHENANAMDNLIGEIRSGKNVHRH